MKRRFFLLALISFIVSVLVITSCDRSEQVELPDLIIQSISYDYHRSDPFNLGVGNPYPILDFNLRIKNIGNAATSDSFFIDITRSAEGFDKKYYEGGEKVNQSGQTIAPGEVVDMIVTSDVMPDVRRIRFLINTEGKPTKGLALPRLEESNYKNNTYELEYTPPIPH